MSGRTKPKCAIFSTWTSRRPRDALLHECGEVSAGEQMAGDPDRIRGLHVGGLVADEKALGGLDRPHAHQVEDHAGSGLPPIGGLAIVGDDRVWMIRAIAYIVDPRALVRQLTS